MNTSEPVNKIHKALCKCKPVAALEILMRNCCVWSLLQQLHKHLSDTSRVISLFMWDVPALHNNVLCKLTGPLGCGLTWGSGGDFGSLQRLKSYIQLRIFDPEEKKCVAYVSYETKERGSSQSCGGQDVKYKKPWLSGRTLAPWLWDQSYSPGDPDLNKLPLLSLHSAAVVKLRMPDVSMLSYRISTWKKKKKRLLLKPDWEQRNLQVIGCI